MYVLQLFSEEEHANVVVVWVVAHVCILPHLCCSFRNLDELEWCTTKLVSTNVHILYQVQLNANKLKIILKMDSSSLYF